MGKATDRLDGANLDFVRRQRMFFVATAPSSPDGHINVSPKGLDTFAVIDEKTVAYLDLVGSGIETVAHLKENGRITILFNAFEGPPNIVRLYGRGEAVERTDSRFAELRKLFPPMDGERSIIVLHIERVSDSCGFGVPRYEYQGERTQLTDWCARKGPDGLSEYMQSKNRHSLDGLPGLAEMDR